MVKHDPRPNRVPYQFNLDDDDKSVKPIIREFDRLRSRRKLTAWIVDMWRLWADLVQGKTDVLIMLFPDFATRLTTTEGDQKLQAIYEQNVEIITLMKEAISKGIPLPVATTGKVLSTVKLNAPPINEDDTQLINVGLDKRTDSADNFINAMLNLQN